MQNDPMTVWGKNPELEKFWSKLASGKYVVIIYKDGTNKQVNMPKRFTKKQVSMMADFEKDEEIVAILSSNPSQDSYEVYLYPMARDKTVDYVIKNYKKYFKPIFTGTKLRVPS